MAGINTLIITEDARLILRSVVGMCLLTTVLLVAMYATRLPAMTKQNIDPQQAAHPGFLALALPSEVRRVADNYNHLFEAPTVFYAIALTIVISGHADSLHAQCASAYLYLRIAHSLVQCTANIVSLRFVLFLLSWAPLGVMIVREAIAFKAVEVLIGKQ